MILGQFYLGAEMFASRFSERVFSLHVYEVLSVMKIAFVTYQAKTLG